MIISLSNQWYLANDDVGDAGVAVPVAQAHLEVGHQLLVEVLQVGQVAEDAVELGLGQDGRRRPVAGAGRVDGGAKVDADQAQAVDEDALRAVDLARRQERLLGLTLQPLALVVIRVRVRAKGHRVSGICTSINQWNGSINYFFKTLQSIKETKSVNQSFEYILKGKSVKYGIKIG